MFELLSKAGGILASCFILTLFLAIYLLKSIT